MRKTVSGPQAENQMDFIHIAQEFAQLMGFYDRDLEIKFKKMGQPAGAQGLWNDETGIYEINVEAVNTPGLPQYAALMGRFMARNYRRCIGKGATAPTFWNEFRFSVVGYLIQTSPPLSYIYRIGEPYGLFQALRGMDRAASADVVQQLALELFRQYDCDWSQAIIADKVLEINQKHGFLPDKLVRHVFIEAGFKPQ